MKTKSNGQIIFNESDLFDAVMQGQNICGTDYILVDKAIELDQELLQTIPNLKVDQNINQTIEDFDKQNQSKFYMPDNYCPDLVEKLYSMCKTDEQLERVSQELVLFMEYNMLDLLFYLKYLVDTMKSNNIIWGVGRGSSVASYVLYLIGVHRIDSLKYNLNINEFLR